MRNSEEKKKTKSILVIGNANFFGNFFLRLEKVNEQKDKTFSS